MSRDENLGAPVVNGGTSAAFLRYVSPSAIEKADPQSYGGCLRRWYYRYVMRMPEPMFAAQTAGVALHAEIEHYLRTGEKTLGPLALAGARFIPNRVASAGRLLIEHPIHTIGSDGVLASALLALGVPVVGYIDLVNDAGFWLDDEGTMILEPDACELVDWKSTGSTSRFSSVTGTKIAESVQMTTYAEWSFRRAPVAGRSFSAARVSHGYFLTAGRPAARKVSLRVVRDDVARRWERIEGVVATMADAARCSSPELVEPNLSACSAYKGCPRRDVCPAGRAANSNDLFGTISLGVDPMSLIGGLNLNPPAPATSDVAAQLAALVAEEKAVAAPAAPPPAFPPEFPTWVAAVDSAGKGFPRSSGAARAALAALLGAFEGERRAAGEGLLAAVHLTDPGQFQQLAKELSTLGVVANAAAEVVAPPPSAALPAGLVPPDAPPPAPVVAPAPVTEPVAANSPSSAVAQMADVAEGKPKRGRPKKSDTPAATDAGSAPPATVPASATASSDSPVAAGGGATSIELYVDSLPPGGRFEMLDRWIAEWSALIAAHYGAVDMRLPPDDKSPIAFGKWRGALAGLLANPKALPPAGRYVLLCRNEVDDEVARALSRFVVANGVAVPR